ncbi:phosphoenolpyruvate-dependent sugar phosphotransferase system, EI component [Candidatus Mycoplasma haematolamae str. Purdue]|uniref:Phosphoenolpyruvate-protein phosphotransferase n=1 Tax=Mycoplasma haematolamae (strain Purdue) TaxID=1212765 RepID=I7CFR7_MYCHA|nr:phosphoenolpyruvate--protein phosphotransferase [Candidatus Mycoplasma haematolamae]AFO52061.1 phosphoenolpyruvate-dependent sugar phosphotransferase system, EI component [Candidatus Mycoplasma haematolamae str. Purdue]
MGKLIQGLGIGEGVVVAKAYIFQKSELKFKKDSESTPDNEYYIFQSVEEKAIKQIGELIELTSKNISEEKADIFRAHQEILRDEEIRAEIKQRLYDEKCSLAWAISDVYEKYVEMFSGMSDPYFRERASDLKDLKERLLTITLNVENTDLSSINSECILLANDLTPSETSLLNKKWIKGFVTEIGGVTSHSAIMAKTMGFPAIVSAQEATSLIKNGDLIALDTQSGTVHYCLEEGGNILKELQQREKKFEETKLIWEAYKTKKCQTLDGRKIQVLGNIGQPSDMPRVREFGGEGVGLFRTEFLYMKSPEWPSEEVQYEAYKKTLMELHDSESVTIRTLDIGGDKTLNYYTFPKEANPFLGYRAIRMSLNEREAFVTQLRAILRASNEGKIKIMFPMITTYEEFIEAKEIVEEVKTQLTKEGKKFSKDIPVGMMIEVPGAALIADQLAKVSDFFSIGSNDLIQYTNAVDRMSENVSNLYQPNSPAILRLINSVAKAAQSNNIEVSVCGEMASVVHSAVLLVGMGIDKLSMSAPSIPVVKRVLNNISYKEAQELLERALNSNTEREVMRLVSDYLEKSNILL